MTFWPGSNLFVSFSPLSKLYFTFDWSRFATSEQVCFFISRVLIISVWQ